MRKVFVMAVAVAGAWGGVHLAINWSADLAPQLVSGATNPIAGLLAVPGGLIGLLVGLVVASLVLPRY